MTSLAALSAFVPPNITRETEMSPNAIPYLSTDKEATLFSILLWMLLRIQFVPKLLGNPRFSDSFRHGKTGCFPDPFPILVLSIKFRDYFSSFVSACFFGSNSHQNRFEKLPESSQMRFR